MKAIHGLAAVLLASTMSVAPAIATIAAVGSSYTFNFTGVCSDCEGNGTGTLSVQNYVLGSSFSTSNFVSFHYNGTDLVNPFTLNSVSSFNGAIGGTTGTYNVSFNNGSTYFSTYNNDGVAWNLYVPGRANVADYGRDFAWSLNGSAAPEPATWAMLVGGFGLVGAAMRRKVRSRVRFA